VVTRNSINLLFLVARVEKAAVIACLKRLQDKYRDFKMPGFTFIVAQRQNGFRLVPSQAPQNNGGRITDADRNLKPGTCISNGIVNPALEQFILVAHRTIQVLLVTLFKYCSVFRELAAQFNTLWLPMWTKMERKMERESAFHLTS
jgi:hypothetical protein